MKTPSFSITALVTCLLLGLSVHAETNNRDLNSEYSLIAKEPGSVIFTPPKDWQLVDKSKLPKSIMAMVVGKGKTNFPPSINLGLHQESGTLKEFLKYVKEVNDSDGIEWKDLGTIRTQAGDASLSQLDTSTEWGTIREMQVIFVKDDVAYILTAAALKDEFSTFYREFFNSMKSLKVNKTLFEMIPDQRRRVVLRELVQDVVTSWNDLAEKQGQEHSFVNDSFQTEVWKPFNARLARDFHDMTPEWKNHLLDYVKKELN
jgi:hypothetical protein